MINRRDLLRAAILAPLVRLLPTHDEKPLDWWQSTTRWFLKREQMARERSYPSRCYYARLWTPDRTDRRRVEVDVAAVIAATKLPVPLMSDYSDAEQVGEVIALREHDGCIDGIVSSAEPLRDNDWKLAVTFEAVKDQRTGTYTAQAVWDVFFTPIPTVTGTGIGRPLHLPGGPGGIHDIDVYVNGELIAGPGLAVYSPEFAETLEDGRTVQALSLYELVGKSFDKHGRVT